MPEGMTDSELVPVHLVAYEDSADLDVDNTGENPTVENHDELVNGGETYQEIRALNRSDAEQYEMDIIEPGDPLWDERFADLESGDAWRLSEIRD